MRNFIFSIIMLLTFNSYAATGIITGGMNYTIPSWFKVSFLDIADDVDDAKDANKHIILFLYLDDCPYCGEMAKDFDTQPLKKIIQKDFEVIAINIKGDREVAFDSNISLTEKLLAEKLQVYITPTVLFLDTENRPIVKIYGYRSVANMQKVLAFVNTKTYQTSSLEDYLNKQVKSAKYPKRNQLPFKKTTDLSTIKTPLAVIFDSADCDACDKFYNHTLQDKAVKQQAKHLTWIRLNADSTQKIITSNGKTTTAKQWAKQLKLSYRPSIVMFDENQEIHRITGFLYLYHFQNHLRYVGGGFHNEFPVFNDYDHQRTAELLANGVTIDLSR